MSLENRSAVIVVNHESRQTVAFAVDEPENVGVAIVEESDTSAIFNSVAYTLAKKLPVGNMVLKCQNAYSYGTRLVVSPCKEIAVVVIN